MTVFPLLDEKGSEAPIQGIVDSYERNLLFF